MWFCATYCMVLVQELCSAQPAVPYPGACERPSAQMSPSLSPQKRRSFLHYSGGVSDPPQRFVHCGGGYWQVPSGMQLKRAQRCDDPHKEFPLLPVARTARAIPMSKRDGAAILDLDKGFSSFPALPSTCHNMAHALHAVQSAPSVFS